MGPINGAIEFLIIITAAFREPPGLSSKFWRIRFIVIPLFCHNPFHNLSTT